MASVTTVELIDDMDGVSAADETVTFGLDGRELQIDLSSHNAGMLRDILGDYVAKARQVGKASASQRKPGRPSSAAGVTARASREQTQAIRDWARQNGFTVSDRGRIPVAVQKAFDASHQGSQLSAVG